MPNPKNPTLSSFLKLKHHCIQLALKCLFPISEFNTVLTTLSWYLKLSTIDSNIFNWFHYTKVRYAAIFIVYWGQRTYQIKYISPLVKAVSFWRADLQCCRHCPQVCLKGATPTFIVSNLFVYHLFVQRKQELPFSSFPDLDCPLSAPLLANSSLR